MSEPSSESFESGCYWDIDGIPLQTWAYNVWTLVANVPALRGSNLVVPYRAGEIWQRKWPEQRTLSLAMWVAGCDPDDGSVPTSQTSRQAFF